MPFSFLLDKPRNISATFEKLKQQLSAFGGKLTGDEKEGFISLQGVEGNYVVGTDSVKITVTKKPLSILPNKVVENQIRAIFHSIAN
ncbi:MAG: hypothetical protein FWE11_09085 [Defluviitaleaceae bacterium]|nr:hypothetical protein [Defluviitaleaceae bacterium]